MSCIWKEYCWTYLEERHLKELLQNIGNNGDKVQKAMSNLTGEVCPSEWILFGTIFETILTKIWYQKSIYLCLYYCCLFVSFIILILPNYDPDWLIVLLFNNCIRISAFLIILESSFRFLRAMSLFSIWVNHIFKFCQNWKFIKE